MKQVSEIVMYNTPEGELPKPTVDVLKRPNVCVVYNHFSLDAMLAAAVYKSQTPNCVVYSSVKSIPTNIESYVIIGMRKVEGPQDVLTRIFGEVKMEYPKNMQFYWIEPKGHDFMSAPSLFHKVCDEFGIVSPVVDHLSYAAGRIYEKDLTLKQLVMVYTNMMLAEAAVVDARRSFVPRDVVDNDGEIRLRDLENFKEYVRHIQHKVNGSINTKYFSAKGNTYKTIVTNMVNDYFWSMRLIRLAHQHVLNLAITPRGYVVDSTIGDEDFKSIELQIDLIKAEMF